jgi:hypothetical protein
MKKGRRAPVWPREPGRRHRRKQPGPNSPQAVDALPGRGAGVQGQEPRAEKAGEGLSPGRRLQGQDPGPGQAVLPGGPLVRPVGQAERAVPEDPRQPAALPGDGADHGRPFGQAVHDLHGHARLRQTGSFRLALLQVLPPGVDTHDLPLLFQSGIVAARQFLHLPFQRLLFRSHGGAARRGVLHGLEGLGGHAPGVEEREPPAPVAQHGRGTVAVEEDA